MEIPAPLFFSFCAVMSITFLILGFNAFDRTELKDLVSPVIMSLFKHALAIFTCHSSSFALIFHPKSKMMVERRYFWVFFGLLPALVRMTPENSDIVVWFYLAFGFISLLCWLLPWWKDPVKGIFVFLPLLFFTCEVFPWYIHIFALINAFTVESYMRTHEKISIGVHMVVESLLFRVGGKARFFPILVLFIAYYTSVSWAAISGLEPCNYFLTKPVPGDEFFQKLLLIAALGNEILWRLKEEKRWKLIQFAAGMMGTVLFQNFFRLTSFSHVVAFLYLAVAWLANLTLLQARSDFGVFDFLLTNVILGCTVNQSGMGGTTWLAYAVSALLYGARLKLESLEMAEREGQEIKIILWGGASSMIMI